MQLLTIILGLTASVSAIDIGLRSQSNCGSGGGGFLCTNKAPNECCGIPSGSVVSVIFYAIPTSWNLNLRGHEGGGCGPVRSSENVFGVTEKCLNSGSYTGAGYGFIGRKKRAVEEAACVSAEACTNSVLPDRVVLADGQKYNIVGMDWTLAEELAGLAENGSVVADIPDIFKTFAISA